jgi:succinoglycan biosynthesis protein ExoA
MRPAPARYASMVRDAQPDGIRVDEELVTVVIPASNEEGFVGGCLDSVLAQDYRSLQVLVVDGASTDGTTEEVRARMTDERVELLLNPRRNIPSSMNMALARARGQWLVRVDAHSTVGPGYVRTAVTHLRTGRWGGVGGRKEAVGITPAGRAIAVAMGSRFGVGNSVYHYGTTTQEVDHLPFGAYPVRLVRELGGWNEQLTANEDFEFDYRLRSAGNALLFDPSMVIAWHCRQSVGDLYRQYHRYGRGKVDVARLHPASLSARHLAPPLFVAYCAIGLALGIRRPRRWALGIAPYAVALTLASVDAARRLESVEERRHLPGAFVAMHVGWGVGVWSRLGEPALSRLSSPRSRRSRY